MGRRGNRNEAIKHAHKLTVHTIDNDKRLDKRIQQHGLLAHHRRKIFKDKEILPHITRLSASGDIPLSFFLILAWPPPPPSWLPA